VGHQLTKRVVHSCCGFVSPQVEVVLGNLDGQVLSIPRTTIRVGTDYTQNYTLHGNIDDATSQLLTLLNASGKLNSSVATYTMNGSSHSSNSTSNASSLGDSTFSYTILKSEIIKMHFYFAQGLASATEYTFSLGKMGPWGSVGEAILLFTSVP
jgi:hypothetical protein